eukprot:Sdes_comp20467_c0_seq1m14724
MEKPTKEIENLPDDMFIFKKSEKFTEKLKRKMTENPFVPLGCLFTTIALIGGVRSMRGGDKMKSQYFMRARIFGQGVTLLSLVGGALYATLGRKKPDPS